MKFTCTQLALSKAVNTVSRAVSSRTTLPVLKGILMTVEGSRLTLSASDLDMSIETSIDVQSSEDGSAVVSAKLFGEIIRKLPNSLVMIKEESDSKINISCIGSSFSIVTLPSDEFPVIGKINTSDFIDIKKEDLSELIKKTVFSASIDEKKGILTGCLLNIEGEFLEMVALDGFRMAVAKRYTQSGSTGKYIIPARILSEILKILADDEGSDSVTLVAEEKKIQILTEDTRVVARLLDGDFINYNGIIPQNYKTRMVVSREDMLSSIERASLLSKDGKFNLVKLNVSSDSVDINSKSEEGNVNEHLGADVTGEGLTIGFNSKYLIDVLKCVGDEEIAFEFGTSVSSCLLKPVDSDSYTFLILPVKI